MVLPTSGDRLLVSERFISLQGEGISTGAPAAFLRLGNCNLTCVYCDTPYSWDAARFDLEKELQAYELTEIATWIVGEAPGRLIITGGEPLVQHKLLVPLLQDVDERQAVIGERRLFVEVETNGTIWPSAALLERVDQWNVSPKLTGSGEPATRRIKGPVLSGFAQLNQAFFKFVVATSNELAEVEALILRFGLERSRVQLMPEARTLEQLREKAEQVASWALSARLRYSGRLHLELYGGKRGS